MAKATESREVRIEIPQIRKGRITAWVVGERPFICNRMSEKARRQLLLPSGRKTAFEKQSSLKHNPVAEFQASPYLLDDTAPTYIGAFSSGFKVAMATAALDLPSAKKAQIGRLVYVAYDYTPLYGRPYLFMSVTRSADMAHTPDIRTRAILPRWAAKLTISFVEPILNKQAIYNLLAASGVTVGVGDWRPEKGKGDYGQYRLANDDDPELLEIIKEDREVQKEAMANPQPYDGETASLLEWATSEAKRRGMAYEETGGVEPDTDDDEA